MVRHGGWPAYSPEIERIHSLQLRLPVIGHHLSVLGVIVAMRPVEVVKFQWQIESSSRCLQRAQALRHDFLADSITSKNGDMTCFFHVIFLGNPEGHTRGDCNCGIFARMVRE